MNNCFDQPMFTFFFLTGTQLHTKCTHCSPCCKCSSSAPYPTTMGAASKATANRRPILTVAWTTRWINQILLNTPERPVNNFANCFKDLKKIKREDIFSFFCCLFTHAKNMWYILFLILFAFDCHILLWLVW